MDIYNYRQCFKQKFNLKSFTKLDFETSKLLPVRERVGFL